MGCSSSTQTLAREGIRAGGEPEEANGTAAADTPSEKRSITEDTETIPDPADGVPRDSDAQGVDGEKPATADGESPECGYGDQGSLEKASDKHPDGTRLTPDHSESLEDQKQSAPEGRAVTVMSDIVTGGGDETTLNKWGDTAAPSSEETPAPSENE